MRLIAVLLVAAIAMLPVFAQSDDIPYVDITAAQAEIAQIDKDIAALTSENEKLAAENKDLQAKTDATKEPIAKASALFEETRNKKKELQDLLSKVEDKALQAKVLDALAKTDQVALAMSEQRSTLTRENADRAAKLKANNASIYSNTITIERKTAKKVYLEKAISKTKLQEENFAKHMAKVDEFLNNAGVKK